MFKYLSIIRYLFFLITNRLVLFDSNCQIDQLSFLDILPIEMVIYITNFLDNETKWLLSSVNKFFREAIFKDYINSPISQKIYYNVKISHSYLYNSPRIHLEECSTNYIKYFQKNGKRCSSYGYMMDYHDVLECDMNKKDCLFAILDQNVRVVIMFKISSKNVIRNWFNTTITINLNDRDSTTLLLFLDMIYKYKYHILNSIPKDSLTMKLENITINNQAYNNEDLSQYSQIGLVIIADLSALNELPNYICTNASYFIKN